MEQKKVAVIMGSDSDWPVVKGACTQLDALDIPYETQRSPLREGCTCVRSIDIGEYDTCGHGCIYCYAGRSGSDPSRRRLYSDDTELLWGALMPRDTVVDLRGRDASRIDSYI